MDSFKVAPDAIILYANGNACFGPSETIRFAKVQSRMLLWCKSGRGSVTANGKTFQISPGSFLFLPWNHSIFYRADKEDPFLMSGIHMAPKLSSHGASIMYEVFHKESDDPEYRKRHDAAIPGLPQFLYGNLRFCETLEALAEYIVLWFQRQPRDEAMARMLAQSLIKELAEAGCKPEASRDGMPSSLKGVVAYAEAKLDRPISLNELVSLAGCSRANLFRLFQKHLKTTPLKWILNRRLERAAALLRGSRMRIGEAGAQVGLNDPYYFSRVFKRYHGVSPREYKRGRSLMPPW